MPKQSRRAGRRDRALRGQPNRHQIRFARELAPEYDDDVELGVQPAYFSSMEHVEEAKQRSHDSLVRQMGDLRDGPVGWRIFDGYAEAKPVLEAFTSKPGVTLTTRVNIGRMRDMLIAEGGHLIIAYAPRKKAG